MRKQRHQRNGTQRGRCWRTLWGLFAILFNAPLSEQLWTWMVRNPLG